MKLEQSGLSSEPGFWRIEVTIRPQGSNRRMRVTAHQGNFLSRSLEGRDTTSSRETVRFMKC